MSSMRCSWLCGISRSFLLLSPAQGQVTYVLLTRSPLIFRRRFVRLACIRHAASVHPEPGSNSPSSHGEHLALLCFHSSECQFLFYLTCFCSVISVRLALLAECLFTIPLPFSLVKSFFIFFAKKCLRIEIMLI